MSDTPDDSTDDSDKEPTRPPNIEAVWIDRQIGSGALDKQTGWSQDQHSNYEFANDGRSDTRTTFYWSQEDETPKHLRSRDRHQRHRDPDNRRGWGELAKWNDGKGEPSRKQDNFEADVERWIQTFCNQLDLNEYQYNRVRHVVVKDIDLGSFGWIPAEQVILGTISLVIDAEQDVDPDEWTPEDWIIYRDEFEEMMDNLDMERGTLWTVRKRVHAEATVFGEPAEE